MREIIVSAEELELIRAGIKSTFSLKNMNVYPLGPLTLKSIESDEELQVEVIDRKAHMFEDIGEDLLYPNGMNNKDELRDSLNGHVDNFTYVTFVSFALLPATSSLHIEDSE